METRIKLLKDLTRMCRVTNCLRCPIRRLKAEKEYLPCLEILGDYPEKVIRIVEEWVHTHPEKTVLDDVREKYPDIALDKDGIPRMCPAFLGYSQFKESAECNHKDCVKCWKQPLK